MVSVLPGGCQNPVKASSLRDFVKEEDCLLLSSAYAEGGLFGLLLRE